MTTPLDSINTFIYTLSAAATISALVASLVIATFQAKVTMDAANVMQVSSSEIYDALTQLVHTYTACRVLLGVEEATNASTPTMLRSVAADQIVVLMRRLHSLGYERQNPPDATELFLARNALSWAKSVYNDGTPQIDRLSLPDAEKAVNDLEASLNLFNDDVHAYLVAVAKRHKP